MTIFGTAGNDSLTGTNAANTFDVSQGGADFVSGLKGNDIFVFGSELRVTDEIHGGEDFDTLRLNGDYSFGLHFAAATMEGVESIELAAAHNYKLILNSDATVAAGQTLFVNGSLLGAGDHLFFDGTLELDGVFDFTGGAGDDVLFGGGGLLDNFRLELGGSDRASGGGGTDVFRMGASLDANDHLDGGLGGDTVLLDGDYSAGLRFKAGTIAHVEVLELLNFHDYKLTLHEGNIAAGALLDVTTHTSTGHTTFVDASRETDGHVTFLGGGGNDTFIGSAGADSFNFALGGNDVGKGGLGGDQFNFLNAFDSGDHVDGGAGNDTLNLNGDYSAGLKITKAMLSNVEQLFLGDNSSYKFSITDGVVGPGLSFTVNGSFLLAGSLKFDGGAETDASLVLKGGADNDVLTGGAVNDSLFGGLGADTLTGRAGDNTFFYQATAADSTSTGHDTITGFDALHDDFFLFVFGITVDAEITVGNLNNGHFDDGVAAATSALGLKHAVLFTPDSGPLSGHTYLVVNTDGAVGYQAGTDLLIEMQGMLNKASLDSTDFH